MTLFLPKTTYKQSFPIHTTKLQKCIFCISNHVIQRRLAQECKILTFRIIKKLFCTLLGHQTLSPLNLILVRTIDFECEFFNVGKLNW